MQIVLKGEHAAYSAGACFRSDLFKASNVRAVFKGFNTAAGSDALCLHKLQQVRCVEIICIGLLHKPVVLQQDFVVLVPV